jgi:hypothetical protein
MGRLRDFVDRGAKRRIRRRFGSLMRLDEDIVGMHERTQDSPDAPPCSAVDKSSKAAHCLPPDSRAFAPD